MIELQKIEVLLLALQIELAKIKYQRTGEPLLVCEGLKAVFDLS